MKIKKASISQSMIIASLIFGMLFEMCIRDSAHIKQTAAQQ